MNTTLYYFYDPMCSWCYAFQPTWQSLKNELAEEMDIIPVLGGLAPDDDEIMPESLQGTIQEHWQRIELMVPGTIFNFEFWTQCQPRRSTYPACRSVIAAVRQGHENETLMIEAIQKGYYARAMNPSDVETHIQLARELGLDERQFRDDMESADTEQELQRQIQFTQSLGIRGFPSLVLLEDSKAYPISVDYLDRMPMLEEIRRIRA